MSDKSEPTLIQGHEYDGIQEYDNPTPGWWHLVFLVSILFSFFYFIMSFGSPFFVGPYEQLAAAQEAEYARMFAGIGELENDEHTILTLMDNEKWVAIASGTFRGNCVSCHGAEGGGQVGPNLCDDSYKNVRTVTDIYEVITNGAANGAMPAWGNRFSHNELVLLASYVASLRGTSPAGTIRGPEGDAIPAWPDVRADAPPAGAGGQ
ncbi:MAG: c-type cytochrome [Phycisphaeraceae bacterium]|nr:c-type cytochrome [Phycisphaeraceae bacterium]